MLTKEVREWLDKVKARQYNFDDAMSEFARFSPYLTREEMKFLKLKIMESYSKSNI